MKKFYFLILMFSFVFKSCTYHCPGFDDTSVLTWLPYKTEGSIRYKNFKDTIVFIVNRDFVTKKDKFTTGFPVMDIDCGLVYAYYKTQINNYTNLSINEYCVQGDFLSIRFVNNDSIKIPYDFLTNYKSDTSDNKQKIKYHDKFEVDNIEYNNVYEIKQDTMDNNIRIWRILLAKNYGIILFDDRNTEKEWIIIK
jgi:hypothetical protein